MSEYNSVSREKRGGCSRSGAFAGRDASSDCIFPFFVCELICARGYGDGRSNTSVLLLVTKIKKAH